MLTDPSWQDLLGLGMNKRGSDDRETVVERRSDGARIGGLLEHGKGKSSETNWARSLSIPYILEITVALSAGSCVEEYLTLPRYASWLMRLLGLLRRNVGPDLSNDARSRQLSDRYDGAPRRR